MSSNSIVLVFSNNGFRRQVQCSGPPLGGYGCNREWDSYVYTACVGWWL